MGQLVLDIEGLEPRRRVRSSALRTAGFEVVEAASGREALEVLRAGAAALVVLGGHLPDMDSLAVVRAIQNDPAISGVPVLYVSDRVADGAFRGRLIEQAHGYLAEPADADELVAQARLLLRLAGAEREVGRLRVEVDEREASHHRAQDHLREGEERLRLAQRAGRLGVYDWDLATGAVVWTSELEQIYGIAAPLDPTARPAAWQALVHPDDKERLTRATAEWLQSGEPEQEWEYRLRRPDGEVRWIAGRSLLVRDADGAPRRVIGTNEDITDRKRRAQQQLTQMELFAAITDNIPVLLVLWDPALNTFQFNRHARETLGWTEADAADGRFMERVYPDPDYRREVSGYMQSFERGWRDIRTTAKDGSVVDISWANVMLSGGISVGIGVDVRERKRLESTLQAANARLEQADRRKDEFLAVLSHELRNPLAPIRYAVPLIRREPQTESASRALAVIERQTDHLTRLVDDLLDLSRITSGSISLRRDYVTLGTVVTAAIEAASTAVAAGRHTLQVEVPPDPVWVHADVARLAQVVTNLLDNSAKYTLAGGTIVIRAGREDGEAVIRVRDNGIGIPPESQPFVFEMFRRVNRDSPQGGLGIGLSLSKRLVDMHGGRISVFSAGPGEGTEMVVRLPAVDAVWPDQPASTDAARATPQRLKVLVVDDNVDLVDMLAMVIEGAGHEVRKAFDGASGISAALSYRPDVLLLDLGLPGMSGVEVARQLRARPETAKTRIVALTGLGQPEDRRQTEDAGFDHHLTKPTPPEEVERLLARFAAELAHAPITPASDVS